MAKDYFAESRAARKTEPLRSVMDYVLDSVNKNIFILGLGDIELFDADTQTGSVTYDELLLNNIKVLSPFKFDLMTGDKVILIQARNDLFSEFDGIHFSKGSVYILQPMITSSVKLEALTVGISSQTPMSIKTGTTSLYTLLDKIVDTILTLRFVTPQGPATVDPALVAELTVTLKPLVSQLLK